MLGIKQRPDCLRVSYLEKDLSLFQEISRQFGRKQETEQLLSVFLEIQAELRKGYNFELTKYQMALVPAILKSGKVGAHIAWYVLASFWHFLDNYPAVFDHLINLSKEDEKLRKTLYEMAQSEPRMFLGGNTKLLMLGALKSYFPTKELRAAFITGRDLKDIRKNSQTPKWQENRIFVKAKDHIIVLRNHRSWTQNWKTKKYEEEKGQEILLYEETPDGLDLVMGLPWEKPKCRSCADQGGVWKPGEVEGTGTCPDCGKKYVSLYGVITSPAFDTKKNKLNL